MPRALSKPPVIAPIGPLEADGPTALRDLRRALGTLLGSIPSIGRAVDLSDRLGLDRSLAWKVWRVAQGPGELPSPKHIPGRAGMSAFLQSAADGGASPSSIEDVRRAFTRLEQVFKEHAGDRASAEILLGRFTDEGRSRLEIQLRREAFRANSHFLGVRMRMRHQLDVLLPAAGPYMPSLARLRGYYGLQRTRPDARWVLSRGFVLNEGGPTAAYQRTALAGIALDPSAVPVVPEFCAPPDLPLRRQRAEGHTVVDELGPSPIGEAGAADIVTAELISKAPIRPVPEDVIGLHVRTPSERLCYELFIHRDVSRRAPRIDVFTTLNANSAQSTPDPRDRIPILETARELGPAHLAPRAVEVPRHAELIDWMLGRLGRSADEFLAYRFSMRFPPIAVVVRATYGLDGAPRIG